MVDQKTFWICKCGNSNRKILRKCEDCGRGRPRYILWFSLSCLAILLFIGLISSDPENVSDNETQITVESQSEFLMIHDEARKRFYSANELEKAIIAKDILRSLTKFQFVENWKGKIVGVNEMDGKGALEIDIGNNIRLFAGEHVFKGVSTLIDNQNNVLFNFVRTVESGTLVTFSGSFPLSAGSLVEISYTDSGAIRAPEYLFAFNQIEKILN